MVTVQKLSTGSKNSIISIASGNNSRSMLNANIETTADESGVVLKVRKPYIISKQREKWTEEEHHKFIEALKLYGRAWRQIEEYIGTKTAVQIRSHAQKIFTKVMKKGSSNTEASNEPIEIPPPRPKRKTLHPYPRKFLEAPNKTRMCSSLLEKGTSANLKTMERDSHSPTSVVAPEGSQISTSHAKYLGSGSASPTSSGSNLSHVVESSLIKDNLTVGKEIEKEGNFLLTLNLGGPSPDELTFMKTAKELKNVELSKNEDAFLKSQIKFAPLKTIKLFGHTVVVASPLEYSDGTNKALVHAATRNLLISTDSHIDPLVFKWSQTHASIPKLALNIDGQLVLEDMGMEERSREKEGSKGISCTGSTNNAFHKPGNAETPNYCREGFVPCKKFVSDGEAVSMMNAVEDKESWRIQVCL